MPEIMCAESLLHAIHFCTKDAKALKSEWATISQREPVVTSALKPSLSDTMNWAISPFPSSRK
jgi:hypothetical protein